MTHRRATLHLITADDSLARRWTHLGDTWPTRRHVSLPGASEARGLALIDGALPGLPPLAADAWAAHARAARLVLASPLPGDDEALGALNAGFSGHCHAYAALPHLRQVLDVVEGGELWVGRSLLTRLVRAVGAAAPRAAAAADREDWGRGLTERERAVAERAALAASNADIAAALGITERTVKAHLSAVFDKLGVADRLQLALRVHGIR